MNSPFRGALAAFVAVSGLAGDAGGQAGPESRKPLSVEAVANLRSFPVDTPIELSPDGEHVAYTVEGARRTLGATIELLEPATEPLAELRVSNLTTGDVVSMSHGGGSTWAGAWSPDGSRLAYLSNRSGQVLLWTWDSRTGTHRRISEALVWHPWVRNSPQWTPDGSQIIVKVLPAGRSLAEVRRRAYPERAEPPKTEGDGPTVRVLRAGAQEDASSEPDWLSWRYGGDLAAIDVRTGELRRLSSERVPLWWEVSPDGRYIAYANLSEIDGSQPGLRLFVVALDDGDAWEAPGVIRQIWGEGISWSPTSTRLAYLSEGNEPSAGMFVVDVEVRNRRRVAAHRNGWSSRLGPTWSSDGTSLYVADGRAVWEVGVAESSARRLAEIRGHDIVGVLHASRFLLVGIRNRRSGASGFARIEPRTGNVQQMAAEPGTYAFDFLVDVIAEGSVAVVAYEESRHPSDLWLLNDSLRRARPVSRLNPDMPAERLGRDTLVRWESSEGGAGIATLLLPPGYRGEAALPVVVDVYAGRSGRGTLDTFRPDLQLLATRGYAVLVPGVPIDAARPMEGHADAVLPAVARLVDLGVADSARIGIMGHSYGGYGTLALLVRTDRFAAAVASAAHGNLFGMHGRVFEDGTSGTDWVETGQGRMGATPWADRRRYVENSPYFFLDRVRTPLLLLHGSEDGNTPLHLAEQIFAGLRRLDRPVVLAAYEGEDHWWGSWRPANQIDYWRRIIAWFDRYLAPG